MIRALVFGTVLCAFTTTATSAEVVKLAIVPAVEPRPALKYQLLPKFIDRRPGNAAPRYAKAMLTYRPTPEIDAEINRLLQLPIEEFGTDEVQKQVAAFGASAVVEELRRAACLQSCEWELPLREQSVFHILLPEVQEMRRLGRYVALRARCELVEGRYGDATATLAVGYAMARHVAESPTLINGLVGHALAGQMDRILLDFAAARGAPSLYAALTFQPRPLVDIRPGIEGEMYSLQMTFPKLFAAADSEAVWNANLQDVIRGFSQVAELLSTGADPPQSWSAVFDHMKTIGEAKTRRRELQQFLIACGRKAAEVEQMSDAQIAVEFTALKFDDLRDETFCWVSQPYPIAKDRLDAALKRLATAEGSDRELIPLAKLMLPAVTSVARIAARGERRVQVARLIEALRLYAASHDGRLPSKIEELQTATPTALIDSITGRPWDYKLIDGKATLSLPEDGGGDKPATLTYEITVAGAEK